MKFFEDYYNWATSKVQAVADDKNDIIKQRNDAIFIENILRKNGTDKANLDSYELLKLPENDLKEIMKIFINLDIETYENYIEVIRLFQKVSSDHGQIKGAEQYEDAIKWFGGIANNLTKYLNEYTSQNAAELIDLKDNVIKFRRELEYFSPKGLKKPLSLEKYKTTERLLHLREQNPDIRWREKKIIGIDNHRAGLLIGLQQDVLLDRVMKYKIILKRYEYVKKDLLHLLEWTINRYSEQELTPNITDEQLIFYIDKTLGLSAKKIIHGLIYILISRAINSFDDFLLEKHSFEENSAFLDEVIKTCEQALLLEGREDPRKKPEVPKVDLMPIISISEFINRGDEIINQAKAILDEETSFLTAFNPDDYVRMGLAIERHEALQKELEDEKVDNAKIEEYEKCSIVIILEGMRQELKLIGIIADKYKNSPDEYEPNYKTIITNLKSLIERYEELRKRRPEQRIIDNNHLFYLTNNSGAALIEEYLDNASNDKAKYIVDIINQMTKHDFSGNQLLIPNDGFDIHAISKKRVVLTYATIFESDIMIMLAADKPRRGMFEIKKMLEEYTIRVRETLNDIKSPADKLILGQEQAWIRNKLANIAQGKQGKKSRTAA